MTLLLIYLFLALFVSALCSIMEAVLLSTPISFLRVAEESGRSGASLMIKLKEEVDRPLSAILSLNTVAHTVGAAGVGAQATKVFGEAYFGLVSAILTILILVVTEIIPKTVGARFWRELAGVSAQIIRGMMILTYPLVLMSSVITRMLASESSGVTTSREELAVLANIGASEGIFGEQENKIIQNLLRLKTVRVSDIMTPRIVVAVADENMTINAFVKHKAYLHFSRIPVFSGNDEHITGYVFRQTIFEKLSEGQGDLPLKEVMRPVTFVPSTKPVFGLWQTLLTQKEHIAIVVDEYGGLDGIVTLEDIIETLIGFEIVDEKDEITDMQAYARERWKTRQQKYRYIGMPPRAAE